MRLLIGIVLVAGLFFFVSADVGVYSDFLWFQSQGVESVFLTVVGSEIRYALIFGLIALVFVGGNLLLARRLVRERPSLVDDIIRYPWATIQILSWMIWPASIVLALIFASVAAGQWLTISVGLQHGQFGLADPLLNRDASFYVFSLPMYQFFVGWTTALVVAAAICVVGFYALASPGMLEVVPNDNRVVFNPPRSLLVHGSALLAVFLVVRAVTAWFLDPAGLLLRPHAVATGALFTDVYARLPAYRVIAVVLLLAAVLCVLAMVQGRTQRGLALAVVGPVAWLVVAIVALGIVPGVVQTLIVRPTELQRETPYIGANIRFTRAAFQLDKISVEQHPVGDLTASDIANNPETINNMRLWDVRPLLQSYQQLQGLRSYYVFQDVDVDRYGGQQVMLSARGLDVSRLPAQAQTWVNQHILYTHGFGAVASTVTDSQGQGQPDFLLKDFPPKATTPLLAVNRPQIYFGEQSRDWFIVGTRSPDGEFDYPSADNNAYTRYTGRAGVRVGSMFRRLLFAWKFSDANILLSGYITPSSKIVYDHTIGDVVRKTAPYLQLDQDPYLVIVNGNLYWIWDAYTVSSNFPYATPVGGVNYMRNSVKIIIDAYNGNATFYRMDTPDRPDPIIDAYSRVFPTLYRPASEMPAEFRAHLRYPEDFFQAQARLFSLYHMTDPQVFYNREDAWNLPTESQSGSQFQLDPYYVTLRLPGASAPEFLLMEPFVPQGKTNMVAWLAARSDPGQYGQLLAYTFPKDTLIFGPQQIESRIDQDTEVSADLTLWNQQGSRVVRGNLLVIPIGNSILYVEPLFLQSSGSNIPELKRVILGTSSKIVIADSLRSGLQSLLATPTGSTTATQQATTGKQAQAPQPAQPAQQGQASQGPAPPGSNAALAQDALNRYDRAQERLKQGDWAGYGTELAALRDDLQKLAAQSSGG